MAEKQQSVVLVACPHCRARLRSDRLARHVATVHPSEKHRLFEQFQSKKNIFCHKYFPGWTADLVADLVQGSLARLHCTTSEFHHAITCQGQPEADRLLARIAADAKGLAPEQQLANKSGTRKPPVDPPCNARAIKEQATQPAKKPRKKVYLESQRGTRIAGSAMCADCERTDMTVWEYADSNYGRIRLCAVCKIEAFERSFGKIDALDMTEDARSRRQSE